MCVWRRTKRGPGQDGSLISEVSLACQRMQTLRRLPRGTARTVAGGRSRTEAHVCMLGHTLHGRANRSGWDFQVFQPKPGTKTRKFVALRNATNSLAFVPGFTVGQLGNPSQGLATCCRRRRPQCAAERGRRRRQGSARCLPRARPSLPNPLSFACQPCAFPP